MFGAAQAGFAAANAGFAVAGVQAQAAVFRHADDLSAVADAAVLQQIDGLPLVTVGGFIGSLKRGEALFGKLGKMAVELVEQFC